MPTPARTLGICNQPSTRRPRDPGVGLGPGLQRQIPHPGSAHPPPPPWTLTKDRGVSNAACDLHRIGAARDQAGTPSNFSLQPGRQAWGKPGASPAPQGPQRLPDLAPGPRCRPVLQLRLPAPPTDRGCRMHGMQLCPGHPRSPNRRAEGRELCWECPGRLRRAAPGAWGRKQGGWGRGAQRSRGERGRSGCQGR